MRANQLCRVLDPLRGTYTRDAAHLSHGVRLSKGKVLDILDARLMESPGQRATDARQECECHGLLVHAVRNHRGQSLDAFVNGNLLVSGDGRSGSTTSVLFSFRRGDGDSRHEDTLQ